MLTDQRKGAAARAVAVAVTITLTVGPVANYVTWTDVLGFVLRAAAAQEAQSDFDAYAQDGQAFGADAVDQAEMPSQSGDSFVFPGGEDGEQAEMERSEIFPGAADPENQDQSVSDYRDQASSDGAITQSAVQSTTQAAQKENEYGEAYRTLSDSGMQHSHPDMRNDPLFHRTEQQLDTIQPDQKQCYASPGSPPGSCVVKHELEIPSATETIYLGARTSNDVTFTFNLHTGEVTQPVPYASRDYVPPEDGTEPWPEYRAEVPESQACNENQALTQITEVSDSTYLDKEEVQTGWGTVEVPVQVATGPYEVEYLQQPNCDNGLQATVRVYDPTKSDEPIALELTFRHGYIDGQRWASDGHGKGPNNSCLDSVKLVSNGQCGGSINIVQGHPVANEETDFEQEGCTTWNGWEFCGGDDRSKYLSVPPGETAPLGKFTKRVNVSADCSFANDCGQYETDDTCHEVRQACKDHGRAGGVTGECYSFRKIYQCVDPEREALFGDGGAFSGCQAEDAVDVPYTEPDPELRTCQTNEQAGGLSCTIRHDMGDPEIYSKTVESRLGFNIVDKSQCTFGINLRTGDVDKSGSGCSNVRSHIYGYEELQEWFDSFDLSHPDVWLAQGRTVAQKRWCKGAWYTRQSRNSDGEWETITNPDPCSVYKEPYEWTGIPDMAADDSPLETRGVDISNPEAPIAKFYGQDGGGADANGMAIISKQEFFIVDARNVNDEWEENACHETVRQIQEQGGEATIECSMAPKTPENDGETITVGDDTLRENRGFFEDYYEPPFEGVSRYCPAIEVSVEEGGFGPPVSGGTGGAEESANTCGELQSDPTCGYISERCVEQDTSGACSLFERTYQCEGNPLTGIGDPTVEKQVSCPGPVRCMGEDCITSPREGNSGFGDAAGKLKALTWIQENADCSNVGTCRIFTGEAMECKEAVGGVQDCCDQPVKTSMQDYLQVTFMSAKVASMETFFGGTSFAFDNPSYGLWKAGANAVDVTKDAFGQAWETFTGTTSESAAEATAQGMAEDGIVAQAQQYMMRKAAEMVGKAFGEQAMNMVFQQTVVNQAGEEVTKDMTVEQAGSSSTQVTWSSGMQTTMSVVGYIMWIYMIYKFAIILIKMAYECVDEEFELASKRELKSVHKIGTYCNDDTAIGCMEERTAYCAYNSPLGRIIMEQARPQLGFSWGSPKDPNCQGLTPQQLGDLDWSRIDLGEWESIMVQNDRIPEGPGDITEANVSGHRSTMSVTQEGSYRPNVGGRTMSKIGEDDPTERRNDARNDLWGSN